MDGERGNSPDVREEGGSFQRGRRILARADIGEPGCSLYSANGLPCGLGQTRFHSGGVVRIEDLQFCGRRGKRDSPSSRVRRDLGVRSLGQCWRIPGACDYRGGMEHPGMR